jgi:hypothetical protein
MVSKPFITTQNDPDHASPGDRWWHRTLETQVLAAVLSLNSDKQLQACHCKRTTVCLLVSRTLSPLRQALLVTT